MIVKSHEVTKLMTVIVLFIISSGVMLFSADRVSPEETVLAEYEGGVVTRGDFEEEFERIPMMYRSRFATLEGQSEFLNSIVISRIFYKKAVEMGVDQREDVIAAVENALENYYVMEFHKRDISDRIVVPESEIESYYNQHIVRFTESPNTVIRYIMTDTMDDGEEAIRRLKSGVDFIDVMNHYSINSFSKRHQGILRNIRSNGYIAGVGMDDELDSAISEAALNAWTGPLKTESGIHIFQVTSRTPKRVKPLSEVREEIVNRIKPVKELEMKQTVYNELKEKYQLEIDYDLLESIDFLARPEVDLLNSMLVSSEYEEFVITVGDLLSRVQRLSPQERSQLNNPEHKKKMLEDYLTGVLFSYEAKNKGYGEALKDNPEAEQVRRNIILTQLFNDLVVSLAIPTSEEIEANYEQNIERYTTPENRSIQLFLFSNLREANRALRTVRRAIRNNDEEAIEKVIEGSLYTDKNGIINNIFKDTNTPVLNEEEDFKKAIWNTGLDELSSISRTEDDSYFFLRVLGINPAHTIPLAEAEERISFMLTREKRENRWRELQEELKEEYNLTVYTDRLAKMYSARELFDLAEEAMKRSRFTEAVQYYDQIIEHHDNGDDDYKALFMKGFVLAEELNRTDEALEVFKRVLANYPHADLHESAEYMIKILEEGFDVFETAE